mmetsp:Transcript_1795/g.6724  ORF Transcript_1795/g.6724 Transcript_1795/m.6724 type:complete len:125 (-) Transcript_1795:1298-1672(-)
MSLEERKTGGVKGTLYMKYARLCGGLVLFTGALLISVVAAGVQVLPNWWLSYWAQQEALFPGETSTAAFLGVYFALGISYVLLVFFRSLSFIWLALVAVSLFFVKSPYLLAVGNLELVADSRES